MLMMYVMLMLMLLVVVVTMTMMTMMTMVMMVMRDSYQAVFLSMTETARRRTERMQEETRSTGSLCPAKIKSGLNGHRAGDVWRQAGRARARPDAEQALSRVGRPGRGRCSKIGEGWGGRPADS